MECRPDYETDKCYPEWFETCLPHLAPYREREVRLLELGVDKGGSLLLWRDLFARGLIVGIDSREVSVLDPEGRIRLYQGRQEDTRFLARVARETAPDGFDLIVDDCSHIAELTRVSFWYLFDNHLRPGGLYVIEDWGTGFWDEWPDGAAPRAEPAVLRAVEAILKRIGLQRGVRCPSHNFGMVGLVKQLVDEQGYADLSRGGLGREPGRESKFRSLTVTACAVFVVKR